MNALPPLPKRMYWDVSGDGVRLMVTYESRWDEWPGSTPPPPPCEFREVPATRTVHTWWGGRRTEKSTRIEFRYAQSVEVGFEPADSLTPALISELAYRIFAKWEERQEQQKLWGQYPPRVLEVPE
ncbi:hypothetical protein [Microbacterium sp.]|uniref:hypothetical protein n=1 Tax=Microbacterium sp. TaxID=51671 RepID=UPI0039E3B68A